MLRKVVACNLLRAYLEFETIVWRITWTIFEQAGPDKLQPIYRWASFTAQLIPYALFFVGGFGSCVCDFVLCCDFFLISNTCLFLLNNQ
jgi:hypothetical protein